MNVFKFILLSFFCLGCCLFSIAQTHNGEPSWGGDGGWILVQFNIDGADNNYCNSNVKDDFKFCIVAHNRMTGETISIGSMDVNGNDTQASFDEIDANNGLTEGNGCDLRLDVGVGNGTTCGQVYLMFSSWALSEAWSEAVYDLKITIKRVSNDDVWSESYEPGTWSGAPAVAIFKGPVSTLQISVPDIAANICEGSILDVSTVATVSNADAGGAYSIALTDGGGTNTFNPSYATVSGDVIKIASNCPAGNYTVKATVTDAASNTAETTFSFAVNAKPDITISANPGTTICKGVPLTLSITDAEQVANQYAWDAVGTSTDNNLPSHTTFNPGNATYSAAPTGTMTYQAVAKSAAGCVDTTELLITVNEAPMATLAASSSTVCSGETITLTATVAAGQTADSWKWVNPSSAVTANSLTVTPVNPGTITYRVKSVKGTCESADYTATVTVNPKPNLSVTAQPVAQCEGNQINLASAILGGATGLTLAYYSDANCTNSTSTSQTVAFADSPKSFWVVGKNATTGCSDTVELKATVNQNPVKPTITGPTEVCEGSTATLTVGAVAGVTYKWYNATGGQVGTGTSYTTPAFTAAASYTVEAEVAGGCKTASDVYNIAINKKPVVVIPAIADVCAGTDISVSATLSNGTAPYHHYIWTVSSEHGGEALTVQSDSTKVNATLGKGINTFTLTVTDAKGCTGTVSQQGNGGYIQNPSLAANPSTFVEGTSSSLTLTAGGDGVRGAGAVTDYDYSQLSPVAMHLGNTATTTFNPPLPTAPTKYQVVMTTAKGCKDSAEVQVQYTARELAWNKLQGDTVCLADLNGGAVLRAKAIFGTTPYAYQWDNLPTAAGVQSQVAQGDSLILTFDATTATAGEYPVKVTLTDAAGKTITQNVKLIIGATPDVKINGDVSADIAVCQNSTLTLTASASLAENVTWLWKEPSTLSSPNNKTQVVSTTTVNTTGTTYKVVGTSVYGCVDSAARKVIVNDLPAVVLTANYDSVCPGNSVRVEVTSGGASTEYTWTVGGVADGEGKSKTKQISAATQFKVQREDANGCIATADTTIQVYVPEVLNLSGDQTVCETSSNLTLTASGLTNGTYSWTSQPTDAALVIGASTQNVAPTVTTTYYVEGTDVHNCLVARDSIVVTVDEMPTFNLSADKLAACGSVKLYDAVGTVSTGATLKYGTTANFTGGTTLTTTTAVSASGLYYVRAENGVCKSDEDTVRVNILTSPQLKLLASTMEACEPDSIDLAANVDWTPGTGTTFDAMNLTYWEGDPATGTQLTSTKVYPGVTTKTYSVQGASTGCPSKKESVTVTIHPKPVLEISVADTAVCTPTADLNLAVSANGGLAITKTYFSDASYTTPVTATVPSGTYYVIGETAAGCEDSIEVTVRVKPHPVVTLTASADMVCENETVSLTVNGGATGDTYSWKVDGASVVETSAAFTSPALTASTSIEVTITNTENCTTVLDTTVGIYSSAVTLVADGNCQGETVTITATLTGDGTATGYTWTGATQTAVANEATLALTASKQTVSVQVTTDKGCTIEAHQEFKGRPCGVLVVEAPDTTICLNGDDVILTAHSFGGTVTDWTWTQIAGTTVALTFADSVLTLPAAGMTVGETYRFEVSVNGGAAKDTADVTIQQGVTITSLAALDSCSSIVNLEVISVNATQYVWEVVSGNGTGYNVPGSQNKWKLDLDGGETEYKVAVKASNGTCEAHDTLSGHILNTGLRLAFDGNDTCGTNIQLPVKYSVNGGYGDIVARYTYQPLSGSSTNDSLRITPPTQASLTAENSGIYVLTTVYATNAPGCVVTVNDTVKIGALPEVELDEHCLALHKDSTFNLNIANSGDFDYIWSVSESSDGVAWTAGGTGDGTTATTVNGMMEDKDLQYIITATDRNLTQCKASDTAHIYRIPDAPVVDIDTVGDRYHAQVIWTASNVADGYTVWGRRWDPYCLTTAYTGDTVYHAEPTGTNITDTFWVEPSMDSLKFFYVTADINVCGSWYNSLSSADTVGYKLDSLQKSSSLNVSTHNNYIAWMFDMSSKGIKTSADLLERISENVIIRAWSVEDQACMDQTYLNPMWGVMGGDKYWGIYDLTVGKVYEFDATVNVGQLLQYGKLPDRISQTLTGSTTRITHNNKSVLPFHKADLLTTENIFDEIKTTVIKVIRKWDVQQQGWLLQTYENPMWSFMGGDKYWGIELSRPGEVFEIDFISTYGSYTWE